MHDTTWIFKINGAQKLLTIRIGTGVEYNNLSKFRNFASHTLTYNLYLITHQNCNKFDTKINCIKNEIGDMNMKF